MYRGNVRIPQSHSHNFSPPAIHLEFKLIKDILLLVHCFTMFDHVSLYFMRFLYVPRFYTFFQAYFIFRHCIFVVGGFHVFVLCKQMRSTASGICLTL